MYCFFLKHWPSRRDVCSFAVLVPWTSLMVWYCPYLLFLWSSVKNSNFSLDLFSSYKVVAVAVLWTLKRSAVFLKSWDGCSSTDIFSSRLRFLCFIGADSWNIEQIIYEWMNERMNDWINEWMNKWVNEWMNEWINEWMNEWRNK